MRGNVYPPAVSQPECSMATTETVVGAPEASRNSVVFPNAEELKTGTVSGEGRIYVSTQRTGEHVEYALTRGAVHGAGSIDGRVVVHDAETLDQAKVLQNGYIHVGIDYADQDVTIVYTFLTEDEKDEIGTISTQD